MAYIGSQPTVGLVTKLSDIASSFDGILTTFQLSIPPGGAGNNFTPGSVYQIIVSLGGVIQNPAADYTLSGSQITFTTAPASGLTCFIIALGQSINVGNPGAGTVTTPSFGTLTSLPLTGATSGTTTIQAPAVAGNNTLTLPTSNGSANQFLKNGATAGSLGWSSLVEDSSGRLLVGTSSARSNFFGTTLSAVIQTEGIGGATGRGALSVINNDVSNNPPYVLLGRSGAATLGSNAVVVNGSRLGTLTFHGADGTSFIEAATVAGEVDGAPGSNDMPGRLVFSTTADGAASPTERMRITCNGYLLLATTSYGGTGLSFSSPEVSGIWSKTSIASGVYHLRFENSNGVIGAISTNASTTTFSTSSDYRLKENVTPVPNGITRLLQLKPSRFNFIADPDRIVDGFIAHEAQAVVPECVTGTKDEVDADGNPVMQGIDQSKLVPLLTAALQEAIGEIELLKARLTAAGI